MGQFALGLRSLLVRVTIFVIMAALLAWALGGTLFPRPQRADFRSYAVRYDNAMWYWRVLVGGKNTGEVRWNLMREADNGDTEVAADHAYREVAGPVLGEDGLYYAGRGPATNATWELRHRSSTGEAAHAFRDRLAIEQQLARIAAGLPLQDAATVSRQRLHVLDPGDDSADE
jgi:hypothetical protein